MQAPSIFPKDKTLKAHREAVPCEALAKQGYLVGIVYYVYILQSQRDNSFYTGYTTDLRKQFKKHNAKGQKYTSKKVPYKLIWYSAFIDKNKATVFEKYLKQGSGFAFARKHLV